MAKTLNKSSLMSFPVPLSRMDSFPLDANSFFETLAAAETYAASNATAYVGQLLTVVTAQDVDLYKIVNAAGTLEKVPDEARVTAIAAAAAAGIADTGFQGSFSECIAKTGFTFKKGMIFLVDQASIYNSSNSTGYLDGGGTDAVTGNYAVEVGDFIIYKSDTALASLLARDAFKATNPNYASAFTTGFSIWQANLHGAVTKVSGSPAAGKYVKAISKNGDTLSFDLEDLPVKSVSITGTGNNVTGATYANGTLTLTLGNVPLTKDESITVVSETLANRYTLLHGPALGNVMLFVNGIKAPKEWYSVEGGGASVAFNTTASGFDIVVGDTLTFVYQA